MVSALKGSYGAQRNIWISTKKGKGSQVASLTLTSYFASMLCFYRQIATKIVVLHWCWIYFKSMLQMIIRDMCHPCSLSFLNNHFRDLSSSKFCRVCMSNKMQGEWCLSGCLVPVRKSLTVKMLLRPWESRFWNDYLSTTLCVCLLKKKVSVCEK